MEVTETRTAPLPFAADEASFEKIFKEHFRALHAYAMVMVQDEEVAEDLVQQLFLKLWEKRQSLKIHSSVKAFLYKCVHHDCLNYLKHQKIKSGYANHTSYVMKNENQAGGGLELKELEKKLREALNELPEQCLTVFQLSRFEELKYREIADKLGVSVKAVEKQMGKALKHLRIKLGDYLPLILLLLTTGKIK